MEAPTQYHKIGPNRFMAEALLIKSFWVENDDDKVAIGEFPNSIAYNEDEVEELKKALVGSYEDKLMTLFTWKGRLNLATEVDYAVVDTRPVEVRLRSFPLPVKNAFDLTPSSSTEYEIYNKVVQALFVEKNPKYQWYKTADQHISDFEVQLSQCTDKETAISDEVARIERYFPKSNEAATMSNGAFYFGDSPGYRVPPSESITLRGEIFSYLNNGKQINYSQFINWWHHLQILNVKEAIKYYNWLKCGAKMKSKKEQYIQLKNIFVNEADFDALVSILSKVNPPVVVNGQYLLGERQRGSIIAWIAALRDKGKIKDVKRQELVQLLNSEFMNLDLGADGRSFDNTSTTPYSKYYKKFLALID